MFDTNIAMHARNGSDAVLDKLAEHNGEVLLSALSLAELQQGLYRSAADEVMRRLRLVVLPQHIPVLPFDTDAAKAYGRIIARCGWVRGREYDRMIAGHAISSSCVMVTNNAADLRDIPGLKIEAWLAAG